MSKVKGKSYPYIIGIIFVAACIAVKSFFGFGWDDEGFFLTAAHRFYMGDLPLYDEWLAPSLASMLLVPAYALWRGMSALWGGGIDGIVLFFRLFYLTVLLGNSIFAFYVLQKYTDKKIIAFCGAVSVLIYSKQNVALYSNNDMAVGALVLTCMLLLYAMQKKGHFCRYFLAAGISFVMTVFCNPYNIFIWGYFALLAILFYIKEKNNLWIKKLAYFTTGSCLIGFLFLIYFFSKVSVEKFGGSLYYVLHGFTYMNDGIVLKLIKWCWYTMKAYHVALLLQIAILVYAVIRQWQKKLTMVEKSILCKLQILCIVVYFAGCCFFLDDKNVIGITYIPLAFYALLCFVMTEKKKWQIFYVLYIPGILLSIAMQCASGTGIYAITTGFAVAAPASFLLIDSFYRENGEKKQREYIFAFAAVLVGAFILRFSFTRHPLYETTYNCRIMNGPYAGIISDVRQQEFYKKTLEDVKVLTGQLEEDEKIMMVGKNTWIYLCIDCKPAAPTIWRMTLENELLDAYFALQPDRIPRFIYVDGQYGEMADEVEIAGAQYIEIYEGEGKILQKVSDGQTR